MSRILRAVVIGSVVTAVLLISVSRAVHIAEHGLQTSAFDIQQGKSIFAARCARCHNTRGSSASVGPNLSQIGSTAANRKPGMTAADYILESTLMPRAFKAPGSSGEMPKNLLNSLDDNAIRGLVAFLCSQGGIANDEELRALVIDRPVEQDNTSTYERQKILRGEELYRGKAGCAACHPFHSGSDFELTAPYLFYRGYEDKEELRKAVISPSNHVAARYRLTTVVLTNGKVVTGKLIDQNSSEVSLLVNANHVLTQHKIPVAEIEMDDNQKLMISASTTSAMPSGIEQLLGPEELDDLLEFLLAAN